MILSKAILNIRQKLILISNLNAKVKLIFFCFQNYGIDWDGPTPSINEDTCVLVDVPPTPCPLNETQLNALSSVTADGADL